MGTTTLIRDFDQISWIYNTYMTVDFPRNERKPLASIRTAWNQGLYDCYQLTEQEQLVGYAFFMKQPADEGYHYLFDYLAIVPEYRDQGYGSVFLKQLSTAIENASCIVGEVENPEEAADAQEKMIRQRRLDFYLRNGYRNTGVTALVFGVPYLILEVPCKEMHSKEEIRTIYAALYKKMIPAPMYRTFFKLNL